MLGKFRSEDLGGRTGDNLHYGVRKNKVQQGVEVSRVTIISKRTKKINRSKTMASGRQWVTENGNKEKNAARLKGKFKKSEEKGGEGLGRKPGERARDRGKRRFLSELRTFTSTTAEVIRQGQWGGEGGKEKKARRGNHHQGL